MQIHFFERHLARHIYPHHNHPRHPRKQNITRCLHYIQRIIRILLTCQPIRAHNRPMRAREPRIKRILISIILHPTNLNLRKIRPLVKNPFWRRRRLRLPKHRNRDPPRNLPRNVPVFQTPQIINQDFLLIRRIELNLPTLQSFNRPRRQPLHINKPLCFQHWLDHCATFIAMRHRVLNLLLASEQPLLLQLFQHLLPRFFRRQPSKLLARRLGHLTIFTNNL